MQTTLVDSGVCHLCPFIWRVRQKHFQIAKSSLDFRVFSGRISHCIHEAGPLPSLALITFTNLAFRVPHWGFMMVLAFARCVYGFSTIVDRLDSVQFLLSKPRAKAFPVYIHQPVLRKAMGSLFIQAVEASIQLNPPCLDRKTPWQL